MVVWENIKILTDGNLYKLFGKISMIQYTRMNGDKHGRTYSED